MKFEKGYHEILPDTRILYPISVTDVQIEPDALVVTGFNKEITARHDYVHGAIVTVRFTSPMPNVIRTQITHFKGRKERKPKFDLDYALTNSAVEIGRDENTAWLKTGSVTVLVPTEGEWRIDYLRDGQPLTGSGPKGIGIIEQTGKTYAREQLSLGVGEQVYGFGERFTPFVKNGQSIDIWNDDGGTNSEYAYKNVPFYLTSSGYGVLVNDPARVSFEVASHEVNRVQFSVEDHSLDYYLFGGPTLKDALEQYTALSGRPALPPDWSFGLWLTTSFTTNYDEQSIMENLEKMSSIGTPVDVFHFDCFWMKEQTWCSFLWDERHFSDPEGMLQRIEAAGTRICVWINPYIAEKSPLFEEGMQNGYLLQTPEGDVYQVDDWQPGMGLVDFTNPEAYAWYEGKLKALLDMGVDAFKTDFGEKIPTGVQYHDGSDPQRMHNYYTYLYNKCVFELLEREKGAGQAVLYARSATCGGQKYPAHWGGDNSATFISMAETLRGGLSLGLSGFGFWSHDIGGFFGKPTPDLYKRWIAFGLLSSHSRLHGNTSMRVPWTFDEEACEVLRFFNDLKHTITPYILDAAREAHEHGWPVLRAMVLEFPDDPTCRYVDTQYMLGSALLVAPVFSPRGEATYYLPPGDWRNLLTGETAQGPVWRTEQHDYMSLPLWVHVERGQQWECLQRS